MTWLDILKRMAGPVAVLVVLFLVVAGISVAVIEPAQTKALTAASVATSEAELRPLLTRLRAASGVSALLVLILVYFMVAKPS